MKKEYPYIPICGQHGYRRHKVRVLLARNKGSTLFADGDTLNAIVTYNIWRDHGLIIVDPDRPRHFRHDKSGAVVALERYVKLSPNLQEDSALLNFFMTFNEIMKRLKSTSLMWVNRFFH